MIPIAVDVESNLVLYETNESDGLGIVINLETKDTTGEKPIISLLSMSTNWVEPSNYNVEE